ncbi:ferrochelatase [Candidatus Roseilinea sp. NK_OTU-006]
MEQLNFSNEFLLAYQSDIKPFKWLGPSTEQVIRNPVARKRRNMLIVPVAFTMVRMRQQRFVRLRRTHARAPAFQPVAPVLADPGRDPHTGRGATPAQDRRAVALV